MKIVSDVDDWQLKAHCVHCNAYLEIVQSDLQVYLIEGRMAEDVRSFVCICCHSQNLTAYPGSECHCKKCVESRAPDKATKKNTVPTL